MDDVVGPELEVDGERPAGRMRELLSRWWRAYWAAVKEPEPNRDNCTAAEYAEWEDRRVW